MSDALDGTGYSITVVLTTVLTVCSRSSGNILRNNLADGILVHPTEALTPACVCC
jgi:hypothetical protein